MPDLPIGSAPTFRDIQQNFSQLSSRMDGKHLRLDDSRGIHLHDSGKWSGIGSKAAQLRAEKHERAFNYVKDSIDRQLGPGKGEEILRNVLSGRDFDRKLISVDDLKRIGTEVDDVQRTMDQQVREVRSQQVESLRGQLTGKLDPDLVEDVLFGLRQDKSFDVARAGAALQSLTLPDGLDLHALGRDLRQGDMGPLQALAKHGLIQTLVDVDPDGRDVLIAKGRDDHGGLNHFTLSGQDKTVIGTDFIAQTRNGVISCKAVGLEERHKSGEVRDHGDRLHIAVEPGKGGRAWDVLLPIVKEFPHLVQEFSLKGDRISLTLHGDEDGVDPGEVKRMLDQVKHDLKFSGIGPGVESDGRQVRVQEFVAYSFEQQGVTGNPINQPLYQALRH